jgi:anti-sigma factor RsiW
MSCDRFEVEIGMRQHGALDAEEERTLDAHLATCASCRAFAASSGTIETALRKQVDAEVATVDWRAIEDGVRRMQRSYRWKLWLAPLFLLQVPLIFLLGTGHLPPRELLIAGPPMTVLLFVGWVWLMNRPLRALTRAGQNREDLVLGYARELGRRRIRALVFAVMNTLLTVFWLVNAVLQPEIRLYSIFAAAVFGGWAAYDLWVRLPRIKCALAEVRK